MNNTLFQKFKLKKKDPVLADAPVSLPRRLFNEYKLLLLCALIPAFVMYLIYVAKEHYPFGDGSVLVLDLNAQYVWFFEALRNFAKGDASLLYSFSHFFASRDIPSSKEYFLFAPLKKESTRSLKLGSFDRT